ncbi:MAG: M1 family metallopeptidase [Bacteroidetes bacterium]|nr:M1 family metallopeptidase [Bacteroidota bacterium]
MYSRIGALSLLLFLVPVALGQSFSGDYRDSYPKNPGIDILNYVFELSFTDDSDNISGLTTVEARYLTAGQSELRLDLINKSDVLLGKGMTVNDVKMNGKSLSFRHEKDQIFINLGRTSKAGEIVKVSVAYNGISNSGLKIGTNKHGDRAFFSDNWSSRVRNWLPTVDHPSDKAMSEFKITAPDHYLVVSNGLLMEELSNGDGTKFTHWKNSVPIATWLYLLGVADFAVQYVDEFDGKSIQTWVARQDRDAGFYDFAEPTKKVLAYYTDLIGPYSYEKLANIVSNATSGGMEAASAIAYSEASITGDRSRRWQHVIIHEIAHQWFGNAVTEADWNDVWLSEGFATYYTLLYREHAYGRDDFMDGIKDARNRVVNFYKDDYDFTIVRDYLEDLNDISGAMMYQKGAWILHMLRERIGIEAYNAGVRSYYAEYQDKNARSADFIRHMEEASGQKLQGYFSQWLRQGGLPHIEADWNVNAGKVKISLRQTQEKVVFDIEVDVRMVFEDGTTQDIAAVKMPVKNGAVSVAEYTITTDKTPVEMIIDPHTRLLATWNITGNKTK